MIHSGRIKRMAIYLESFRIIHRKGFDSVITGLRKEVQLDPESQTGLDLA